MGWFQNKRKCWRRNAHHHFISFFLFGSNPKYIYLYLYRAPVFNFVLVHTGVRQGRNYYIIIFTIKKHHFTSKYVINCLIGLLSFFHFFYNNLWQYNIPFFFFSFRLHYVNIIEIIKITRMDYDKIRNDHNCFVQYSLLNRCSRWIWCISMFIWIVTFI